MEIEIWSDVACPWCYVGKRRFEAALAQFEHADDVQVTWRSFELDPEAPAERVGDRAEHLASKYGMSIEQARQAEQQMTQAAAGDGLDFRFGVARAGNTFDAHRLVHLADTHGLQDAMKERLLLAYFSQGELVSAHETLVRLAGEVGVPEAEAAEMLASDRYADEVRADERLAGQFGISAVPTFVVDRSLGAAGAQPPEALLGLLRQGWERRRPAVVSVAADGESCGVDGC
jgi:predicted DsbA family dithiol-disulfide isomerase